MLFPQKCKLEAVPNLNFFRDKNNLKFDMLCAMTELARGMVFGLRSWRYAASKLWNAIPDGSRKIQTYASLKNNLKTLDLTGL